jgi:hypothetical protein
MIPLHRDPHYTFRFAADRLIPRLHLEGVGAGRRVDVFRIDSATGDRLGLLTTGVAGYGRWVDVVESLHGLSDRELLERFAAKGDEAAFDRMV